MGFDVFSERGKNCVISLLRPRDQAEYLNHVNVQHQLKWKCYASIFFSLSAQHDIEQPLSLICRVSQLRGYKILKKSRCWCVWG